MGLLISRNGRVRDYSQPKNQGNQTPPSKVHSQSNRDNSRGDQNGQERGSQNPYQKALDSYSGRKSENTKANSVASLTPIVANKDITVEQALAKMSKYSIHHLLFTDENKAVSGIISDRDILDKRRSEKAFEFATKEVIIAQEVTDIKIICSLMIDKLVSAVPLVDEKGQLTGIITKTDILEHVFRSQQLEVYV